MISGQFLLILIAGIATTLLGWAWFHPAVFGTRWMHMNSFTPEMVERGKKRMPLTALIGLLAAMLVAWVMSYIMVLFGVYDLIGAVELGFWLWLGFIVPVQLGMVLWEGKPWKLYIINVAYYFVNLSVMATILALWP